MVKLSIVLIHYNNSEDIKTYLSRLVNQTFKDFEVIIVDNDSKQEFVDDLNNFLEKFRLQTNIDPKIFYQRIDNGSSGGSNYGIKRCLGDLILTSNNDIYFGSNQFLEKAVEYMKIDGFDVMTPEIRYYNTGDLCSVEGFFDLTNYRSPTIQTKKIHEITKIDNICGCCMFTKRKVFKDVKLFDKNFFMYWDDTDFCYRVSKAGFNIIYNPEIVIYHDIDEEKERQSEFVKINYFKNKLLFIFKHYSMKFMSQALLYTAVTAFISFLRIKSKITIYLKTIISGISFGLKMRIIGVK